MDSSPRHRKSKRRDEDPTDRYDPGTSRQILVADVRSTSSSSTDQEARRRRPKEKDEITPDDSVSNAGDHRRYVDRSDRVRHMYAHHPNHYDSDKFSFVVVSLLTMIAFALRFYKINHPDQVVFDEVHFGKFAAYYILREYYFDVHPPLAKMMLGAAGWFVGFDGRFEFESIGDSYSKSYVPYVGIRALPALLGTLTVPVVYGIMKETGFPTMIAAFSACLIVFDNGHIAQTRLILLDAALVFFIALSLYCYIRFRKLRYHEFSGDWWGWMIATGICLACSLGCKMVGLFTFFTIGSAVLVDLWNLLDHRKGLSMDRFYQHFFARVIGLIIIPAMVYLSFFWMHFKVLKYSGTGDSFMSPAFQETLMGSEMLLNAHEIRYYDIVTLKHKDTKAFLHSHVEKYPLRYEDGRISSAGQQVTCYPHNDTNNNWQIIPTKALPATGRGRIVRNQDVIQLRHVSTDTVLLTHDVASPLMPTNQEFTTIDKDDTNRYNETLFHINLLDGYDGDALKSKATHFRLIHTSTKVALWTHAESLPDWAFNQQEVNGNKNANDKTAVWYIDDIIADESGDVDHERSKPSEPKPVKKMNFFRKFGELQLLMLQHNAGLTASHPYASGPINWPFLLSGISFWTENDTKKQIYMIGNVAGWGFCVMALSIFVGIVGADALARRRDIYPIPDHVRNRLLNATGFFVGAWAFHYFPFFLMNRQLFLHHYLPAHLCSALVAGSVLNFILTESINYPISVAPPLPRPVRRTYSDLGFKSVIVTMGLVSLVVVLFLFLSPLTYGTPGLDGDAVNRRRLLSSWTLHFAAKQS